MAMENAKLMLTPLDIGTCLLDKFFCLDVVHCRDLAIKICF
jgi:hypothetical protein